MKPDLMLLLHHWRRTRLWLILPLMVAAAYTTAVGIEIAQAHSIGGAWDTYLFSLAAKAFIVAAGTLGLVVAMGSGEANAAFPRYAHSLPITDRRWSVSYALYSLLAIVMLSGVITVIDSPVWNRAVAAENVRAAAVAERAKEALKEKVLAGQITPPVRREPQKSDNPFAFRASRPANTGIRQAPMSFSRHAWDNYGVWNAFIFLTSIAFFSQSLFVALTLVQRVPVRVFAIAAALVAVPLAGFALVFYAAYHRHDTELWLIYRYVWPFVLMLAGFLIMHLAARRERHGERALQRFAEFVTRPARAPVRGFDSPQRALAWYDWTTFGRYLIYGTLPVAFLFAAVGAVSSRDITGVTVLPACGLAGLYIAYRLYHGDRHDHDSYLITLPFTVERLSKSRLANVAKYVAVTFVMTLLLEAAFIAFSGHTPQLTWFMLFAPICAYTLVWLTGPLFYPLMGGWLLAALIAAVLRWLFLPRVQFEVLFGFVGGSMACLLIAAALVWLIRTAKRRGLLFSWNRRWAIAVWIVSAILVVPMLLEESKGEATMAMFILPLFLCLLPAAPFLAVPLAIDRYRHR